MTLQRQVTAEEAADLLGVPVSTIRVWKHRGRVVPVGLAKLHQPGRPVPLYALVELEPLAADWHERRAPGPR